MDWYAVFKFLHVSAAVCWVGGGVVLMYLAILGQRAKDDTATMTVVKQTASLATTWFIPSSMATLLLGIVVASIGGLWSEAWVILGLLGFAATFATGFFVIRPSADAIAKHETDGRRDLALAFGNKLMKISKFDYVMLFTVIADMVVKPAWSDVVPLAVMALVLIAGAALFLLPGLRVQPAAA
jgi:hypothetical protein